jgi:hypothetical protein
VELNRRSLWTLARRDFRQVWVLITIYCLIIGCALVPPFYGDGSLEDKLSSAFIGPEILALLAVVPFVQTIVWREKAAGTFLFLRMLPLTDNEILLSKLLVVTGAGSLILFLPALGMLTAASLLGGRLPPMSGWLLLWEWVMVVVMAGWSTASAIVFSQQWAAVVPYMALVLVATPFVAATYMAGPAFWQGVLRYHAYEWGLVPAAAVAWHGWWLSFRLFRSRDFAQLVE